MRGSGRGLLLIQTFVDEFTVKKAAAGGAEVTLVKYAISD
jgi:anti-sigma regulatory factor (Ser/Thr protein kinase)